MYTEILGIVSAVIYPKISKRHIAKHHIKVVIWELCFLKALDGDIRFLVKLLCNPARQRIYFHAVEL